MDTDSRKEFIRLVRNIQNACFCIEEWAEQSEANAQERGSWIHWGHVGSASKVLKDLKEIGEFLDITIEEV